MGEIVDFGPQATIQEMGMGKSSSTGGKGLQRSFTNQISAALLGKANSIESRPLPGARVDGGSDPTASSEVTSSTHVPAAADLSATDLPSSFVDDLVQSPIKRVEQVAEKMTEPSAWRKADSPAEAGFLLKEVTVASIQSDLLS